MHSIPAGTVKSRLARAREKMKKEMKKEIKEEMKKAEVFNYYHKDLSGSYSIKKTLPVLVPSLT